MSRLRAWSARNLAIEFQLAVYHPASLASSPPCRLHVESQLGTLQCVGERLAKIRAIRGREKRFGENEVFWFLIAGRQARGEDNASAFQIPAKEAVGKQEGKKGIDAERRRAR